MESKQESTDGLIREPFGSDQDFIFVLTRNVRTAWFADRSERVDGRFFLSLSNLVLEFDKSLVLARAVLGFQNCSGAVRTSNREVLKLHNFLLQRGA